MSDFDQIDSNIAIWHDYDPDVKAEMCSTRLTTSEGMFLIDPIPLAKEALDELIGSFCVAGIIVTNSNHHRVSAQFATKLSAPVFARCETFPDKTAQQFRSVADGGEICNGLRVIGIEGAAAGEIVLHYLPDGGTLIIGDALINFEPYGFNFFARKILLERKRNATVVAKTFELRSGANPFRARRPDFVGAERSIAGFAG
jgi:hypothetical protein